MTSKTPAQILLGMDESLKGLHLEIEALRTHQGSSADFILLAIEKMIKEIQDLKNHFSPGV